MGWRSYYVEAYSRSRMHLVVLVMVSDGGVTKAQSFVNICIELHIPSVGASAAISFLFSMFHYFTVFFILFFVVLAFVNCMLYALAHTRTHIHSHKNVCIVFTTNLGALWSRHIARCHEIFDSSLTFSI